MSNIIGEGFDPAIISQINKRQEIYGSINRTPEQLQYLNANAGWVRLASSVDIDQKVDIRDIPPSLKSSELAKKYVLFGGIQGAKGTNFNNIFNLVTPDRGAFNTEAYGIGGLEFGIKPMPGIKSAQIKTLTRGSLKEATIQIIANNRTQFDIIDILYLRLGFTMLLEWGHASYFDNEGEFVENNPYDLYTEFLGGELKYNNILNKIQKFRLESDGNYDALAGKVVNFNWKYNRNGSYTINLILRSLGDVIESLKSNILLGANELSFKPRLATQQEIEEAFPTPAQFNAQFPFIVDAKTGNFVIDANGDYVTQGSFQTTATASNPPECANEIEKIFKNLKSSLTGVTPNKFNIVKKNNNYYKQIFQPEGTTSSGASGTSGTSGASGGTGSSISEIDYIKLGHFLELIQQNLIPIINDETAVPLSGFNLQSNRNLIFISENQISSDPRICTFQKDIVSIDSSKTIQFAPEMAPFYDANNNTGKILNAYFGMDWIAQTIRNELITSTGEMSILDLVKALCNGWNRATGYVNKLGVQIDETTNKIYIYDETSIPGRDTILTNLKLPSETAEFLAFRTIGNKSGFIKDIDFTTQIPANFATLITIGSTANGYVLGADATALSRMNAGLKDRVKPTISSPRSKEAESIEDKYKDAIATFNTFIANCGYVKENTRKPIWIEAQVNTFVKLQPQFLEYEQYLSTQSEPGASSPNIGFLPFNMSLTMDGLSGMKVYQKFKLETDFLPSNYPNSLEFIIKSITHTIQNNEWITNIESIAIPKNPFSSIQRRKIKVVNTTATQDCSNNVPIPYNPTLLVRAKQDYDRWVGKVETTPGVYCYLKEYWDSIDWSVNSWTPILAWSSAYVAWLTRGSGFKVDNKFDVSNNKFTKIANTSLSRHVSYVQAAVTNAKNYSAIAALFSQNPNNITPFYKAEKIDATPVKVGDILIYNQVDINNPQNTGTATFSTLYDENYRGLNGKIHGDVVISVGSNTITTQGGNLSDTVRQYSITTRGGKLNINSVPYPNGPKYIMHLQYVGF